jgi:hypothetical protein|tara:strand:- start:571 stop:780 length:210 start_codon:yes stop_codon:yes gene_type:complete
MTWEKDVVHYNMAMQQYTKCVEYKEVQLMLVYERDMLDEYVLKGVQTPDGQDIMDLMRDSSIQYLESTL